MNQTQTFRRGLTVGILLMISAPAAQWFRSSAAHRDEFTQGTLTVALRGVPASGADDSSPSPPPFTRDPTIMSAMNTSPKNGLTPQLSVALILGSVSTLVSFLLLLRIVGTNPPPAQLVFAWGGFIGFAGLLGAVLFEIRRRQRGSRS
ncbi:MAG TPA: hypothetical protein VF625_11200 [Longimicrobium sp.]